MKNQTINEACWLGDQSFCTVGVRHYYHYEFQSQVVKKRGLLRGLDEVLLCVKEFKGGALVGTQTGKLQVWSGCSNVKQVKCLNGAVHAIHVGQNILVGGAKTDFIAVLNDQLKTIRKINLDLDIPNKTVKALNYSQE